jgi:gluconolactonase
VRYDRVSLESVTVAGTGFNGPEGVAFDQEGNLYGGGQDGIVYRMTPDGQTSAFATVGGRPTGLAFDREDTLFVCEPIASVVLRVTRSGEVSSFAEYAGDYRIVIPNFCTFDAEGNLYVSSSTDRPVPNWAQEEHENPQPRGALVRLRPDGSGEVIASGLYLANGTAIDPGEQYVYVLQSTKQDCIRIAINKDGTPGEVEPYGANFGTTPDGMAFDADGNLIVTLPLANRVVVIGLDGALTTLLEDEAGSIIDMPTNCAFGGERYDELYVGHLRADHVAKLAMSHVGHRLYNLR